MSSEQKALEGFDEKTESQDNEWEEEVFSEVIDINDYPSVEKGEEYKSVGMSDVGKNKRKIQNLETKEYSYSRPRFRNGQTLMARITPCLENGKTAFVDVLDKDEAAIGSTEFIVLSDTEKTTPKFVYYTARRPEIRQFAIKRMTGTSGRQRVPLDIFDNKKIKLPPLSEQKKITSILDNLDTKIETNNRINEILEDMAHRLFKSWFVDYDPYENFKDSELGKIPEDFEVGKVDDIVFLKNGSSIPEEEGEIPAYGGNGITDYTSEKSEDEEVVVVGRVGAYCGNVNRTYQPSWISDNAIRAKPKDENIGVDYVYQLIKSLDLERLRHGTSQPLISQTDLSNLKIVIPTNEEIKKFENTVNPIFEDIGNRKAENRHLEEMRDALLPKLMSGKIRVNVDGDE